ncbi:histone-lysine N-methyltransferase, H3 lysine-79 specific-like isoform X2 [Periplaneta americana]
MVMDDVIYDEQESAVTYNLNPKPNDLHSNKTESETNIKLTSRHENGYSLHHDATCSRSRSHIEHINAAVYIERLDTSLFIKNISQGDGKFRGKEILRNVVDDAKVSPTDGTSVQNPNKQAVDSFINGGGDRLSLPSTTFKSNGDINLESSSLTNNRVRNTENALLQSVHNANKEEDTISSSSFNVSYDDSKCTDLYSNNCSSTVEKPVVPVLNITSTNKSILTAYSNLEKRSVPSPALTYTNKSSSDMCSSVSVKKYSVKLTDTNTGTITTFPEKCIRRKILNLLSERGEKNCGDIDQALLQNCEDLIRNEDMAWHRWYISKLEEVRQKEAEKKTEENKKKDQEEREKELKEYKQENAEKFISVWKEKKAKENEAKRKELAKKAALEKQKKEIEEARKKSRSEIAFIEWRKKKDIENKEKKLMEENQRKKVEEEKKVRAVKSKIAFDAWSEKAKTRPKPMPIVLRDNKGRPDPSLVRLNWNPIPWKSINEQSNIDNLKCSRGKTLIKPFSTWTLG